jgi:adenosylcobinamide-GDP ribazoletransferase
MAGPLGDLRAAFSFLTILPMGAPVIRKPGYAFAYFPVVGLGIGLALATMLALAPAPLGAFLALALWVILTGALHLDGFGDACDGLAATVPPARRLEIMKDPRAGAYAVVGVALLLLGKWVTLGSVAPLLVVVPPVAGRWAMTAAAFFFPAARTSGSAAYFRQGLGGMQVTIATVTAAAIVLALAVTTSPTALWALVLAPLTAWGLGAWACRRLGGGLTGDVYGALCETTELICLVGLVWSAS